MNFFKYRIPSGMASDGAANFPTVEVAGAHGEGQYRWLLRSLSFSLFLLLLLGMALVADAQISLDLKQVEMETAFREIKKQSGYGFWYEKDVLKGVGKVSLSVKDGTLKQVLELCFREKPLSYELVEKTVVVKRSEKPVGDELGGSVGRQKGMVRGRVLDESGRPIIGATVKLLGNSMAVSSGQDGNFSIALDGGSAVLQVSYLGFIPFEQSVKAGDLLTVTLKEELSTLANVNINAGYYSVRDIERTGSISRVSAETIAKQPVGNPLQALQGRVAGVEVTQMSGMPGGGFKVQVRGRSSINNLSVGNEPLYVIDGVTFPSTSLSSGTSASLTAFTSPLSSINPYDIACIEVLKDADATAIYGSRGANGVILITTKRATTGENRIGVNVSQGFSEVAHRMDLLNTHQYLQMRREAFAGDGLSPAANQYDVNGKWDPAKYNDWQEQLIGGAAGITNASLNLSGGGRESSYLLGGNYYREGTVFPGEFGLQRLSFHSSLNLGSEIDRFHARFNASYSHSDSKLVRTDPTSLVMLAPNTPDPYDGEGNLSWLGGTNYLNPMSYFHQPNDALTTNLVANVALDYRLVRNLTLKTSVGYTNINREELASTPLSSFAPALNLGASSRASYFTNNLNRTWLIEPQLDYVLEVGKLKLSALVGSSFQQNLLQMQTVKASGYNSDELMGNIASAALLEKSQVGNVLYRYNSVYGRINLNLSDRYIINLTARRDGSSRFGEGRQFANFGAIGTAWVFSREKFIRENLSFLDLGKLRASYGITGNDQIPDYGYLELWASNFAGTYQGISTIYPTRIANSDYAWEINRKAEVALQLAFFGNRLNVELSFYRNVSSNQLVGLPLPLSTGFTTIQANLPARVQNTGWELVASHRILDRDRFKWSASVNLTIPRNKLLSYPDLGTSVYADSYILGQPLSILKNYNVSVDGQTGLYAREDHDGNGVLNNLDRYLYRFTGQYLYGGIQNSFSYGGFGLDFLVSLNRQNGRNYLSFAGSPGFWSNSTAAPNQPRQVLERWRAVGDAATVQRFSTTTASRTQYLNATGDGGLSVRDASYVRLKNVSISYQLPKKLLSALKLKSVQVNLQGQNLFTLTKYVGLDPESQGLVLPPLRTVMMGLNINL